MRAEKKRRIFYIVPGILIAAAVLTGLYLGISRKDGADTVMTINGQPVTREEYQMVRSSFQSQVQASYSTQEANSRDFWSRSGGEDSPLNQVMELALQELKEKKVMVSMAEENGIDAALDYDTVRSDYEADADVRSNREDQTQTVYGPDSLSLASYYEYRYTSLGADLRETIKAKYTITEDELRSHYSQDMDQYTYQTQVSVTVCEVEAETAGVYGVDAIGEALRESSLDELQEQFPDAGFYELTMNDLDMQEGKSGVYAARWQPASQLREGQISDPIRIGENILIMKCTGRQENGSVDFESVKGILESQYQTEMAEQEIEKKVESADVDYKEKDLEDAALGVLEK